MKPCDMCEGLGIFRDHECYRCNGHGQVGEYEDGNAEPTKKLRISEQETDLIVFWREEKEEGFYTIAENLGRCYEAVRNAYIRRTGKKSFSNRIPDSERVKIVEAINSGMTQQDVANLFSISTPTVRSILKWWKKEAKCVK